MILHAAMQAMGTLVNMTQGKRRTKKQIHTLVTGKQSFKGRLLQLGELVRLLSQERESVARWYWHLIITHNNNLTLESSTPFNSTQPNLTQQFKFIPTCYLNNKFKQW